MRLRTCGELLEPFDEFEREMFRHITHGSSAITEKHLHELKDVFIAHGVFAVEVDGVIAFDINPH